MIVHSNQGVSQATSFWQNSHNAFQIRSMCILHESSSRSELATFQVSVATRELGPTILDGSDPGASRDVEK